MSPLAYATDREDWQYYHFSSEYANFRWDDMGDGKYEAVMLRNPKLPSRYYQPVCWIFPGLEEWKTGDLFSQHPDKNKKDHWKYEGRADDMLILDSGHNFHPARYEQILTRNPAIKEAVIVGRGRASLAVVTELPEGAMKTKNGEERPNRISVTLRQIWSSIEECNALSTTKAMIPKEHVVFVKEGKPLPRTMKGTIKRSAVEDLYAEEIRAVYEGRDMYSAP